MRRLAPIARHRSPVSFWSRPLGPAAALLAAWTFIIAAPSAAAPVSVPSLKPPEPPPHGVYREEAQGERPATGKASRAGRRPILFPPPPLEEVYVFQDSLDGLSLDDQGGWTHFDASGGPTAWHIDTFEACTNHGWWCGKIDSSWVLDSNRAGLREQLVSGAREFGERGGSRDRHHRDAFLRLPHPERAALRRAAGPGRRPLGDLRHAGHFHGHPCPRPAAARSQR